MQNGLPFWCWLTQVVLQKRQLNGYAHTATNCRNWYGLRALYTQTTHEFLLCNTMATWVHGKLHSGLTAQWFIGTSAFCFLVIVLTWCQHMLMRVLHCCPSDADTKTAYCITCETLVGNALEAAAHYRSREHLNRRLQRGLPVTMTQDQTPAVRDFINECLRRGCCPQPGIFLLHLYWVFVHLAWFSRVISPG